jgi:hypothetical protein
MKRLFALCAVLICGASPALSQEGGEELSLFSLTVGAVHQEECNGDPLQIAQRTEVNLAVAALNIGDARISFVGCRVTPFMTTMRAGLRASDANYVIYYPRDLASDAYSAPITHELAHVFQSIHAGGFRALKDNLSSARIELGADFIAGWTARRSQSFPAPAFYHSVHVIGRYREESAIAHGAPEDRVAAFSRGYYFPQNVECVAAHNYFQTEAWYELGLHDESDRPARRSGRVVERRRRLGTQFRQAESVRRHHGHL